jgi:hypothetical protein
VDHVKGSGNAGMEGKSAGDRDRDRERTERAGRAYTKKGLVRAPSGKDLFKGREVGLMRRSTSMMVRKESQSGTGSLGGGESQSQTQRGGLLGRKTSEPKRRVSGGGMWRISGHSGDADDVQTAHRRSHYRDHNRSPRLSLSLFCMG